jgi:uncharacterized protein
MKRLPTRTEKAERGPVVIEGFPGIGGISSITTRYIIDFFNLREMMTLELESMPPVTIIRKSKPVPAVTVHGGMLPNGVKIAVIHSEIPVPENGVRKIASEITDWAMSIGSSLILSPQGMLVERDGDIPEEVAVYGTSSSESGMGMLRNAGIEIMEEGVVSGIPGLLLQEGAKRNLTTIALLAEARTGVADTRSAALMIHAVDRLCLKSEMDCEPVCNIAIEAETTRKNGIRIEMREKQLVPGTVYR